MYIHIHIYYTYIYISIYLFIFFHLPIYLHLSIYLFIYPHTYLSICLHLHTYLFLSIYLSIYLYIYTYTYVCIYLCKADLQLVRGDLVGEADAAALLGHVDDGARVGLDVVEREVELFFTVTALGAQHLSRKYDFITPFS